MKRVETGIEDQSVSFHLTMPNHAHHVKCYGQPMQQSQPLYWWCGSLMARFARLLERRNEVAEAWQSLGAKHE